MKKKLLSILTLLLTVCSGAWADDHTWLFNTDFSTELATMSTDDTNWESSSDGYRNTIAFHDYRTLKIGDDVFSVTDGLKFFFASQRILFRSNNNVKSMQINTNGFIAIPNLKKGYTVRVQYKPSATGNYIAAYNLSGQSGFSTTENTNTVTATGTVARDGAVYLWAVTNTSNVYYIDVLDGSTVLSADDLMTAADAESVGAEWDFTSINSADKTSLDAAVTAGYWSGNSTNGYSLLNKTKANIAAYQLYPFNTDMTFTTSPLTAYDGLMLYRPDGSKISNDGKIQIKSDKLFINGPFSIVVPNVKKGDLVQVDWSASSKTLSAIGGTIDDNTSSSTKKTANITVTESGELVITPSNSAYFYAIRVIPRFVSGTIASSGYSSFSSSYALDLASLPTGLTAYQVEEAGVAASSITMTEVTEAVAASTGLILKGTAGETYNIPVAASGSTLGGNLLVAGTGASVASESGKTKYVLQEGKFAKIGGTPATVPAGKAYLEVNKEVTAPVLEINFEDINGMSTGINAVQGSEFKVDGEYYNLAGQRVAQPTKGLYIVNGKKYIVK